MAKETLEAYFPQLLKHEGGYVDHPRDPGGATNMGITHRTLADYRGHAVTKADVKALTKAEAMEIYRLKYWALIGADHIPKGPDAALFDVAVNSGVGRARQWRPLIEGKGPVEAVKAVCARRRSFFQSLRTFSTFGKGWMRRVNEVEAWCFKWVGGGVAPGILKAEAAKSKAVSKKSTTGAVATGGSGAAIGGASQLDQAAQVNWFALGVFGLLISAAVAFLVYRAMIENDRAKVMQEAANG